MIYNTSKTTWIQTLDPDESGIFRQWLYTYSVCIDVEFKNVTGLRELIDAKADSRNEEIMQNDPYLYIFLWGDKASQKLICRGVSNPLPSCTRHLWEYVGNGGYSINVIF